MPGPSCKCPDILIVLGTGNPIYNFDVYKTEKACNEGIGQWPPKMWGLLALCEKHRAITSSDKSTAEKEEELGQLCVEFAGYIAKFVLGYSDLDFGVKRELLRFLSEDADLRFLSPDESPGLSYLPDARHEMFGKACETLDKLFKLSRPNNLKSRLKRNEFLSFMDERGRQYFYHDDFYPGDGGEAAAESIIYQPNNTWISDLHCKRPSRGTRAATSEDAKKERK